MSWIFRHLTAMLYGWLLSGFHKVTLSADSAPHMEIVRKLKTGTAVPAQMFPFGKHCQCHGPPRPIREASPLFLTEMVKLMIEHYFKMACLSWGFLNYSRARRNKQFGETAQGSKSLHACQSETLETAFRGVSQLALPKVSECHARTRQGQPKVPRNWSLSGSP